MRRLLVTMLVLAAGATMASAGVAHVWLEAVDNGGGSYDIQVWAEMLDNDLTDSDGDGITEYGLASLGFSITTPTTVGVAEPVEGQQFVPVPPPGHFEGTGKVPVAWQSPLDSSPWLTLPAFHEDHDGDGDMDTVNPAVGTNDPGASYDTVGVSEFGAGPQATHVATIEYVLLDPASAADLTLVQADDMPAQVIFDVNGKGWDVAPVDDVTFEGVTIGQDDPNGGPTAPTADANGPYEAYPVGDPSRDSFVSGGKVWINDWWRLESADPQDPTSWFVTLDGSGSTAQAGATYTWYDADGTTVIATGEIVDVSMDDLIALGWVSTDDTYETRTITLEVVDSGGSDTDTTDLTMLPEPGTMALMGLGGLILGARRRRRRS